MLETGRFYHLYNRGNNRNAIFFTAENYHYFLKQFHKYLYGFIDVYAYCLLSNHFHFLIRIKEDDEVIKIVQNSSKEANRIVSNQFRKMFISYSQAINKQENRSGSLFQKNFKIKEVHNDIYFSELIFYIHANPQLHGLTHDFKQWRYSSYQLLMTDEIIFLKRDE